MSESDQPKWSSAGGLGPRLQDGGRSECSKVVMRSAPDPLSFVVCVFSAVHTHTLQPAPQTPCPFSENTTCVTKAANLLSTAVSPVCMCECLGEHFLSPSQSPPWSHSNPLSHHRTKINHYVLIGLLFAGCVSLGINKKLISYNN